MDEAGTPTVRSGVRSARLGAISVALTWALGVGCVAGGGSAKLTGAGGGAANGAGGAGSGAGNGGAGVGVGGSSFVTGTAGTGAADGGRPEKCDDAGHCSCINIVSIGQVAHYGANNDNTDAFTAWLNSKSSATLSLITTKPTITASFLAGYDVVILQALEDGENGPFWQFSQAEQDALSTWVQNGGGLITLTGYGGDADEVDPDNQLLQFASISYNKDDILGTCPGNEPCYCWGNSVPLGGWAAASPISANLTQVGAFHGRSINSTGASSVVCTDGTTKYAVSQAVGKGKVFVYCDEWVTYTSQWLAASTTTNPSDPCYNMSAGQVFQVPQFWYNAIKWVSSDVPCFDISDPGITK
jgi:hypothetical protein